MVCGSPVGLLLLLPVAAALRVVLAPDTTRDVGSWADLGPGCFVDADGALQDSLNQLEPLDTLFRVECPQGPTSSAPRAVSFEAALELAERGQFARAAALTADLSEARADWLVASCAWRFLSQPPITDPVNAIATVAQWKRVIDLPGARPRDVVAALLLLGAHGATGVGEAQAAAALSRGIEHLLPTESPDVNPDGAFAVLWPLELQPLRPLPPPPAPVRVHVLLTLVPAMHGWKTPSVFSNPEIQSCEPSTAPLCSSVDPSLGATIESAIAEQLLSAHELHPRLQPKVLLARVSLDPEHRVRGVHFVLPDPQVQNTSRAWGRGWRVFAASKLVPSDSHQGLLAGEQARELMVQAGMCMGWSEVLSNLADEVERSFNKTSSMPQVPDAQGMYAPEGGHTACEMKPEYNRLYGVLLQRSLAQDLQLVLPRLELGDLKSMLSG